MSASNWAANRLTDNKRNKYATPYDRIESRRTQMFA